MQVTIGRIVIFDPLNGNEDTEGNPAIIQQVNEDGTVNLHVFEREGLKVYHNVPEGDWFFPPRVPETPLAQTPASNSQAITGSQTDARTNTGLATTFIPDANQE
jgi:hypothetical protein